MIRFFSFILESNLHLWVFQKAKLHSLKQLVQFQLFEKLTRANQFQIELESVWLPIQNELKLCFAHKRTSWLKIYEHDKDDSLLKTLTNYTRRKDESKKQK